MPCRDRWIGWSDRVRDRRRHLMVVNSRFLVFPWVRSKNLASSVLAMAARRLADDRERIHGWRPVLRGTFVDETRFRATRQRAANRERGKPAGGAFRRLHRGILANTPEATPWKGRGILAVDGSKIALPRELAARGYRVPDGAHYPQGMVSVPYRLRDRIPVDLHLFGHGNERLAALTHLDRAAEGDVIVYDRGYHSFAMAIAHLERGLDFVFRVKKGANPTFDGFIASGGTERTVTLDAPRDELSLRGRTLRVRLVRYTAGDTEYCLATSLTDGGRFGVRVLSDPCHGRWGIEETSRSGKSVIERFHARSERGVRQEPCAAFVPLTLARRFSSRCDADLNAGGEGDLPAMRSNFLNGPRLVGRGTGALFMRRAGAVRDSVARIMAGLSRRVQRERPGRGYPRRSMRSGSKWQNRQAA
ncbi:MAG: DUF4338 domain-containing protein [Rhodobacter sp.]|nr:DUF4338 domain-containing protein [Rhodobacter sp.]